ncbi:MAG: peptidyl-prolyl cis-trans isomerase SurA [Acidobacteriota bacterium]|jgi:parvulin-like peptidyl-prolyl isomerase|nr:peptidyl-prolyl cis-trans isomerase SurA [Acidobacteriota bacterium]
MRTELLKNIPARLALAFAALVLAACAALPARAQEEAPPVVLDEPVAQVDNYVIMLSQLKRENNEFREVLTKQRGMTPEQAEVEIQKKQPEVILNLINEALLVQKGKDIPRMSEDVEAEVNREVLRVAKTSNIATIEQLEEAMRQEGLLLSDVKETMRRQFMRQAVLQREVDAKVYYGLTDKELHDYYDAHRERFVSVTLSELFLSLAGRTEDEVRAKAADLAKRARTGVSFEELVEKNSEHEATKKTKGVLADPDGKTRWFFVSDLSKEVAAAVKDVKAGGITDPVKADEGYMILRVNERDDSFKENFVRGMLTQERGEKEREKYLRTLRIEAYIKPADAFKDSVQPLLDKDKQQTAAADGGPTPAPEKKDKSKKQ